MSKSDKTVKQTEASRELERIFGHEEEANLTGMDVLRLRLVQRQYSKSNVYYRMFFDKHYRPDRFDCIVNDVQNHKNINEFRTHVMHKYYRFPVASQAFLQVGGYKTDIGHQSESQETDESVKDGKDSENT